MARSQAALSESAPATLRSRIRAVAREHPRAFWGTLAAVTLLVVAWVGLAVATTQHVFAGSTVGGVAVSGTPASARNAVKEAGDKTLAKEVTLTAGKASLQAVPTQIGVSVDAAGSVRQLTGLTLNPVTLAQRVGGASVPMRAHVNTTALSKALTAQADSLSQGTTNASITLEGTTATLVKGKAGRGVDVEASVKKLATSWPVGASTIALVEGDTQPAVTDEDAQKVIDTTLTPLLSGPITLTAAGTSAQEAAAQAGHGEGAEMSAEQIASLLTLAPASHTITVGVDADKARELAVGALGAGIESAASDSTFTVPGDGSGQPTFVAAVAGRAVDGKALGAAILKVASAKDRTVTVPITESKPAHGEDADTLGVKEIVGEFATPYPNVPARNQNLKAGTAAINGTVVRSGETFSLTDALGEVDAAHGFTESGVINNGVHTNAMGGGLSQVATTTFNAAFEAGMDDVEHHPHSYYFTRYPAGREATLWTGHLDVKWKNSTPYAAVVQAWLAGGQVHVRLWSTKYYTVAINSGPRTNVRAATVVESTAADCAPYGAGQPGFSIQVTRTRTKPDGTALKQDTLNTTYQPDNGRRCVATTQGQ